MTDPEAATLIATLLDSQGITPLRLILQPWLSTTTWANSGRTTAKLTRLDGICLATVTEKGAGKGFFVVTALYRKGIQDLDEIAPTEAEGKTKVEEFLTKHGYSFLTKEVDW